MPRARLLLLSASLVVALAGPGVAQLPERAVCPMHQPHSGVHERTSCQMTKLGMIELSETKGLGQIEVHGNLAAVVQREDGRVALVDISDPTNLRVLGRYDGNTGRPELDDPFDGDVAFSPDGRFLFYARQTHDFSLDGLHVIDVSNPSAPALVQYVPGGGTLRVAYHRTADAEYVVTLDAFAGMVVFRFQRTPAGGTVVPVHVDALPQLKVGGPASAGVVIDPNDPKLGKPLLYVSTGRTGLQVFDFSTPERPVLLGAWDDAGLADIAVDATATQRTVYAATEYWFTATTLPRILTLDATDLNAIAERQRFSPNDPAYPAGIPWRAQGLAHEDGRLYVAHSHGGLGVLDTCCLLEPPVASTTDLGAGNNAGEFRTLSPYAMDVEPLGDNVVLVSDASTGTLSVFRFEPEPLPAP
jgi:hypothetical protein